MGDEYRIDSHKMMFHPGRVASWLDAGEDWDRLKTIYPIYIELSPFGACNHRCVFCAMDYVGYKGRFLDTDVMAGRLEEMAGLGVKSIMFGGEGEPLLHKDIGRLTSMVHGSGIDLAITTNGVRLTPEYADAHLDKISWIKVSLNAGTAETYAQIHRASPDDFHTVIANLKHAVQVRNANHHPCTLGCQLLLLPENAGEVETLIRLCKEEIGLDYLVVKPYSQHMSSLTDRYSHIDYSRYLELGQGWTAMNSDTFQVIFREKTMANHLKQKAYPTCHSTPMFWAYVMAGGDVYSCSAYLGDPRFNLGNLHEQSFRDIWEGEGRKKNLELLHRNFDIDTCRNNCRMDAVNRYLWELKKPHRHVNFI